MNPTTRLEELLTRVEQESAEAADYGELRRLMEADPSGEIALFIQNFHYSRTAAPGDGMSYDQTYWQAALEKVLAAEKNALSRPRRVRPVYRWAAAAVFLLLVTGVYLWQAHRVHTITRQEAAVTADIRPGGNKAVLTLGDGTSITLDSAANGAIARQGTTAILKLANGQIAYEIKEGGKGPVMMNTMRTPRGGQYQLGLPDGSRIWLNAASSITYPTVFTEGERKVVISGEAYLEVARDKQHPFLVEVDGRATVEVLGTSFNINSYKEEDNIRATLLEGSIRVSASRHQESVVLKPGQQAQIAGSVGQVRSKVIDGVDMDEVMAWKNGLFNLQDEQLPEVMRQLQRWYDIEVRYEGTPPVVRFKGEMDRGVRLSDVLGFLSKLGIRCRLEGRTLVIVGEPAK